MAVAPAPDPSGMLNPPPVANPIINVPQTPPLPSPGQWQLPMMQQPNPMGGSPQLQNAKDPSIYPNLSGTPLGIDPSLWNAYMTGNPIPKLGGIVGQGGVLGGLGGLGGLGTNNPNMANNFNFVSPVQKSWLDAISAGRKGVAGINNMPMMFANYGAIPTDPVAAYKMFYLNGLNQPPPGPPIDRSIPQASPGGAKSGTITPGNPAYQKPITSGATGSFTQYQHPQEVQQYYANNFSGQDPLTPIVQAALTQFDMSLGGTGGQASA